MSQLVSRLVDRALHRPVRDFKHRQGKRIRGSMVQICFEMAGGNGPVSNVITEAIECLHAGSLVIDDVQDDSQYRRGEPTLQRVIGIPLAINAGNWMYFRALELLMTSSLSDKLKTRLVDAMVTAGRRCHEGQALDLSVHVDQIAAAHWNTTVAAISRQKTGVLVELAVDMGCIAANATKAVHSALTAFGFQTGVALQMRNDLEELRRVAWDTHHLSVGGCTWDDDLRHARVTWPWAWAFELVGEMRCQSLVRRLGPSANQRQALASELLSIVQIHGDRTIAGVIRDQLRLLSEHVVDQRLLVRMRESLQRIEQPPGTSASSVNDSEHEIEMFSTTAGAQK